MYSANFLSGVEHYEGFYPQRYKDPVGKWTIGIGHLLTPADPYTPESVLTHQAAVDLLISDQVDQIHVEKQEFLGGQLDAANKLLGKIQLTAWGTSAYPDDVYNALRMIEQSRP